MLMAVPPPQSFKEVIDLTRDENSEVAQPANGLQQVKGNRVGGHPRAHAKAHPLPASSYPPNNSTFEPPAKRQKLSEAPQEARLYDGQHVAASTAAVLSPYVNAAVDSIRDATVDRAKLRTEVRAALLHQFGPLICQHKGQLPKALQRDIDARSRALAKNFASLSGFRLPPTAAATPAPPSAPSPAPPVQSPAVRVPLALATRPPPPFSADPASRAVWPRAPAAPAHAAEPEPQNPSSNGRRSARATTPPSSARRTRTAVAALTSPENFRSRAKLAAWKSEGSKAKQDGIKQSSSYFALEHRPCVDARAKEEILKGNGRLCRLGPAQLEGPEIFHVDFTLDEAHDVRAAVRRALRRPQRDGKEDPCRDIAKLLRKLKDPDQAARLAESIKIQGRRADDILNFFHDVLQKRPLSKEPQILSLEKDVFDKRGGDLRESRLSSLLFAREVSGNRGFSMRRLENFTNEFHKSFEDGLELRAEFTNCAGDVSTISWVSDSAYIAGTTVHMDSHNQQYNKPGNLLLGTASPGTVALKAYPDHRIPRPLVQKGENSTDEMRESQDPWLYTSVVSSDYDPIHGRTYTSGFDRTVKAWKVEESGSSMTCLGTWKHDGVVNFVQASKMKNPVGFVATASDVPVNAVRIYRVNPAHISSSMYYSFSGSRIQNADGTPLITDKWAYFPSTMKWGNEENVKHLLLVGFSPRSFKDDDSDIPQDRVNTGELCLWDSLTGEPVRITGANSQNVFEVLWHPTQPVFIMASSPTGNNIDISVRTQVRIFARIKNPDHGFVFSDIKALDCPAVDINELTIKPNSPLYCYVTAGCTDGNTYVWDSAVSDKPIHVLAHGPPLEGVTVGDDEDDTGIKFTAWGMSLDRFYTGSSDGVVKVWSFRGTSKAKGRVLLEAPAQISYGAFSPDFTKLVVGDASGRVFVLSAGAGADADEDEEKPASFVNLPGAPGTRRRPTPITPHPEPPPPPGTLKDRQTGISLGRAYLDARQLRYSGDQTVGMVQDINYAETGLFRREAHADYDPARPVMAYYECQRQENLKAYSNPPLRTRRVRRLLWDAGGATDAGGAHSVGDLMRRHAENCTLDAELERLSLVPEVRDVLAREGVGPQQLRDGLFGDDFEYIDEVDEVCKKAVVRPRAEDDDNGFGY